MNTVPFSIIRALLGSILLFILLIPVTGCQDKAATPIKKGRQAVPVTIVEATRKTVPYKLQAVGNVEPMASVDVQSQVGGQIIEQKISDGQYVKEGDVLFRLDPRPFEMVILESRAKLDRDRAMYNKAKEDLRRYSTLKQKDVVAQEQYDDTYSQLKSLEGTIALNQATLERSQLDLEFATIRASISGRVGNVLLHKGNVIKANDDRILCVINQIQPIYVSFALPERYLAEVITRQKASPLPVEVQFGGNGESPPRILRGRLAAIDNAVDTTTGTIRLRALFANTQSLLWPGLFLRTSLVLRTLENALFVPSAAVLDGLNGPYVYVVGQGNKVQPRNVKTGLLIDGFTVIDEGLETGEKVVLDGHLRLAPGIEVSIKSLDVPGEPDQKSDTAGVKGEQQ